MKTYLVLICLIVLSAVFSETGLQSAAIIVIPNAAVALINDSTNFNCSTTSEKVEWLFSSDEDLHQSVIYSYGTVKPLYQDRFRVDKYANNTGKQFNLVLQSVVRDDTGRYICRDPDRNEEGEAQLIVLETQPVCKSNLNVDGLIGPNSCDIKPETVQLSCSVRYTGNQVPKLQWVNTGENIAINSSKCSDSGNVYTCNLTMESELQMDGSSYVCQTTQSTTRQYNCTEGVFRIIYALGEQTELIGRVNEKVNCSVNSNSQLCTYSWIFDNGTTTWTESRDRVIELKRPGRFICEANCPIRDMNCTVTAMTVNVNVDSVNQGDGNTNVVAIIVTIVGIVAVIGIIVFILWKKRRQTGASRKNTAEDESLVLLGNAGRAVAGDIVLTKITPMADEHCGRRVRGLAILDYELFVAFQESSIIEVFTINSRAPYRKLIVDSLQAPGTIAACVKNSCFYIIDQTASSRKKIFRVKPNGIVINTWETDDDDKGRISVNCDGNIVMTVHDKHKLKIYSPDGTLLRTIDFSGTGIDYIFHAINLADGNFIIGHGTYKSDIHQVCKIDATGNVLLSFGNEKGSGDAQLDCPAYVAEGNDGSILVADRDNDRIIRLDSDLKFVEKLFTKEKHNVSYPGFMFVYEKTKPPLLFLGCNESSNSGGYVLVLRLGH